MDKLTVSKFDGHDFAVWKFQMMDFLEYHGLLEIVEGTKTRPETGDTAQWDKSDKKARFYIGLSLESTQIRQVMNLKTSAQMWSRLESLYELKNATSKHLLLQKFFEYKMEDNTSVAQHVANIEEMAKQLEDLGHKQDETTLITKVLHSLPSSFRNKGLSGLTLDDANTDNALYSKGKRDQTYYNNNNSNHKNSKKYQNRDQNKFKGKCHKCRKIGHKRSECYSKTMYNDKQTNS